MSLGKSREFLPSSTVRKTAGAFGQQAGERQGIGLVCFGCESLCDAGATQGYPMLTGGVGIAELHHRRELSQAKKQATMSSQIKAVKRPQHVYGLALAPALTRMGWHHHTKHTMRPLCGNTLNWVCQRKAVSASGTELTTVLSRWLRQALKQEKHTRSFLPPPSLLLHTRTK